MPQCRCTGCELKGPRFCIKGYSEPLIFSLLKMFLVVVVLGFIMLSMAGCKPNCEGSTPCERMHKGVLDLCRRYGPGYCSDAIEDYRNTCGYDLKNRWHPDDL